MPSRRPGFAQYADALDVDFDHVAGCMGPTPAGVPVGMKSPGIERHGGGDVDAASACDGKDEVARVAVLFDLAVHACFNCDAGGGIDFIGDDRAAWGKRCRIPWHETTGHPTSGDRGR